MSNDTPYFRKSNHIAKIITLVNLRNFNHQNDAESEHRTNLRCISKRTVSKSVLCNSVAFQTFNITMKFAILVSEILKWEICLLTTELQLLLLMTVLTVISAKGNGGSRGPSGHHHNGGYIGGGFAGHHQQPNRPKKNNFLD